MKAMRLGLVAIIAALGCGSQPTKVKHSFEAAPKPVVEQPKEVIAPAEPEPEPMDESERLIAKMLDKVARVRGLPIKSPVPGRVLSRDALQKRLLEMTSEETPREAIDAQGDFLALMELVPPEYDFFAGAMALIGGRVAGYYDPKQTVMVLAGDLSEDEATETLAHELAHALVDQSFSLAPHVKYHPGEGDRSSAVHAFIEGDATSAMLDVMSGSAFNMHEDALRAAFVASTLLSEAGAKTPRVISSSLVAPYIDGFACIQALRRQGDWPAVDEVWRKLPETTEQMLHLDKLMAREPAEAIDVPSVKALEKDGFKPVVKDVLGEQGLRIALEDFVARVRAKNAAAGWGGDRYVVMQRDVSGKRQVATALRLRMDTVADAEEVAEVFERKYGKTCREREKLGPLAWERKGRDLSLIAGPFERREAGPVSVGSCKAIKTWLAEAWRAAPPVK